LTIANIVSDKILILSSGEVHQDGTLLATLVLKSSEKTKRSCNMYPLHISCYNPFC